MVVYNTTSQEWHNVTSKYTENQGRVTNGAAHFVPSFGPEGLLVVVGGITAYNIDITLPDPGVYVSITNGLYMYEPVSQEWHAQQVTGEPPEQLASHCMVGVQGDSSYEARTM